MKRWIATALVVAAAGLLPACAGNDTRSDDQKALARERAAEERGRREAEEEARRREAMRQQQRRAPAGVGQVGIPPAPDVPLPTDGPLR